jgi:GT2 family glycosyltransferase
MFSIIIPTFNTCDLTLACLDRIQAYPPLGPYEVIVVDNNSTDGTFDQVRLRFPAVIALRNPGNLGFSRACNRGAQEAKGKHLLFLNSDAEPVDGTFEVLLSWMEEHPETGIAGPELMGPAQNLIQMSWGWYPLLGWELIQRYFSSQNTRPSRLKHRLISYLQRKPRHVPLICGASLMIRRAAFEQISGFDEAFELYFEDSDLCWRCAQKGWKVDFVPASRIVHHLGQSTQGAWNLTSLIYQQSHITFYRKHAPKWSVFLLKAYLLMKWLRLWAASHLDGKEQVRAQAYSRWYLRVILESARLTLDHQLVP